MNWSSTGLRARLLSGAAGVAIVCAAGAAHAEEAKFAIPPQSLASALSSFSEQSGRPVLYRPDIATSKTSVGLTGELEAEVALNQLLAGTGLAWTADGDTFLIVRADQAPQGGSAASGGATVEALIVTAQKREEDIQDVPIAISAFSQEDLTRSQIAGGPDLITQIPNMTFTKTNFTSYSIQIRGIGTQAISATTDPAVAVAFNNTPFVRNHFFEQEFYDLQRVEVLRGPQGTLYGRNATAGVVNVISAKPKFFFEAKASGDIANYNTSRVEGMVNIPLVEDAVALRAAGAWTKRDGYAFNQITGAPIDGRDLWSTRLSVRFAPSGAPFDVNLIWEHFEEDDDRLRSGKQLCKTHRPAEIDGVPINLDDGGLTGEAQTFSQGCERVSLYSPDAFQVPNGYSIPYYQGLQGVGLPLRDWIPGGSTNIRDPYISTTQSRDLRVIESTVDPEYRAKSEIFQAQIDFDLSENLTLTAETAYSTDELFSKQDLNRFNTTPGVFANSHLERVGKFPDYDLLAPGPNGGGIWCDPQIGCADRLVAVDLSTSESNQFSQELRLGSAFEGPFNFSLGANFLRADTLDKYYVFINTITLTALNNPFIGHPDYPPDPYVPNVTDNLDCRRGANSGWFEPDPDRAYGVSGCQYIDPNPIGSLNDKGHNYFLSKNPYKLISYAVFGEAYYSLAENLKVTAGLRWTVDKKEAPRIPSWLLASETIGHPVADVVRQEWREPTGRLTLDWKPDLAFTDETMVYASYARGYKAGGANPPAAGAVTYNSIGIENRLALLALFPRTFEPEFVDAFEIGSKNTLLDGRVTLNTAAFYYDYKGYQISEIVERAALNRNFDTEVWGLEIEADWRPLENLRLSFKGGYQGSRLADNQEVIDLMDRTAGRDDDGDGEPDWVVVRPFPAIPSNCVVPVWLVTWGGEIYTGRNTLTGLCRDIGAGFDPVTMMPYVPNPTVGRNSPSGTPTSLFGTWGGYPAGFWNGYPGYDPTSANSGAGFPKDVGGNELPNAPNFTATISGDYTIPLPNEWLATLHTDLHWQAESWWRVFQDHDYARLDEYFTMNLAAIFVNEDRGWNIMAYIKNVTDETALTGAFLYSDDVGLTTNVFLTEPRLYGLRVTKAWSGGPLLGTFGARRDGPYPFTVELGGQVQRHDASGRIEPSFASSFSPAIDPLTPQNDDLDWGDGREVRLTYRPDAVWQVQLGARFGEANHGADVLKREYAGTLCNWSGGPSQCPSRPANYVDVDNYSSSMIHNNDEHTVVDFEVRRDFGIGSPDAGSFEIGAGLRYAHLQSDTDVHMRGIPDWDVAPFTWPKYPTPFTRATSQHTEYEATLAAEREFKGVGPMVTWEGSRSLVGDGDTGHLNLDASATVGVLFGKQKTRISGEETADYFDWVYSSYAFVPPTSSTSTAVNIERSESVSVPTAGVSLGVSYSIDRFSVGAGYRWERYFDAIDGGYAEHEDTDRTIDGPYFKIAVGFGG